MTNSLESNFKTISVDNGKEFSEHKAVTTTTNLKAYFALPYHSWERGLNENNIGLLRQYFRKSEDFALLSIDKITEAAERPNNRPREWLEFKVHNQLFLGINPPVALVNLIRELN